MEGGRRPRAREAAARLGLGQLQRRVPPRTSAARARGDVGLAHDPDHRRRRAGDHRARRLRRAARRWPSARLLRGARGVAGAGGDRRRLRRARAAHVALRRLPRGPGDVDAARARHGAGVPPPVAPRATRRTRRRRSTAIAASRSSWRARCREVAEPLRAAGRARRPRRSRSPSRCSSGRSRAPIPTTTPTTTWSGAGELLDGLDADLQGLRRADPASALRRARRAAGARLRRERGPRARARLPALARARWCSAPTGSARRSSGAGAARWRALFVAASASFLLYAARGYVDAPFLALVVWAGVLEAERRGRGAPLALLVARRACCGPRRGCSPGWRGCGTSRATRRVASARSRSRSIAAPLIWALVDLRGHRRPAALAARHLRARRRPRARARARARARVVRVVRRRDRPPAGRAAGARRRRARVARARLAALRVPLALFAAGVITFVGTGALGLSILPALPDGARGRAVPVRGLRAARLHGARARAPVAAALGAGLGGRDRGRRDRPDHPRAVADQRARGDALHPRHPRQPGRAARRPGGARRRCAAAR